MKYRLQHYTAYHYVNSVSQCHNEMRMVPRNESNQRVISCEVLITPKPESYYERRDTYDNHVNYFNIRHSHTKLITHVNTVIETFPPTQTKPDASLTWEDIADMIQAPDGHHQLEQEFVLPSPLVPIATDKIKTFANSIFTPKRPILETMQDLTHQIFSKFTYEPGMTAINTPLHEAFDNKQGVCQDFAHIAIACVRSAGLPARYVSGYLETSPPEGKPKLVGADASHAWFSVFVPALGWLDFDPTNNKQPDEGYVKVAYGRDYSDVSPLNGVVFGGGKHTLDVRVDMRPNSDTPVDIIARE